MPWDPRSTSFWARICCTPGGQACWYPPRALNMAANGKAPESRCAVISPAEAVKCLWSLPNFFRQMGRRPRHLVNEPQGFSCAWVCKIYTYPSWRPAYQAISQVYALPRLIVSTMTMWAWQARINLVFAHSQQVRLSNPSAEYALSDARAADKTVPTCAG